MSRNAPILTSLLVGAAILTTAVPQLSSALVYDRGLILSGELWRLLTCHLVHFNARHLLYDLLAFGVAAWCIEQRGQRKFATLCALMAPAISISLLLASPGMSYYGGMSGLACGCFFYLALLGQSDTGITRSLSLLVLIVLPLKVLGEVCMGGSLLPYPEGTSFVAMPLSHAVGMTVAVLAWAANRHVATLGCCASDDVDCGSLLPL